jgi:hypothetical protein
MNPISLPKGDLKIAQDVSHGKRTALFRYRVPEERLKKIIC